MKKRNWIILSSLAIFILFTSGAWAKGQEEEKTITVKSGDIVSGNLYATGENVIIDGIVSGDVIGAAQTITVNGTVGGDLIAAAQEIIVNGKIDGNARIAAEKITVPGEIGKNANLFGVKINFASSSLVGWDLLAYGDEMYLEGSFLGSVDVIGQTIGINSLIKKDTNIKLEGEKQSLIINPSTKIDGNLKYTHGNEAFINNQSIVSGSTTPIVKAEEKTGLLSWLGLRLLAILAALLSSLALYFGLKRQSEGVINKIEDNPLRSFLFGLIFLIATPIAALLCALTIIGLPISLSAIALYLVILYLAKVLAAMFAGKYLFENILKKKNATVWPIVAGVSVCWLIFAIPYFGTAFALAAAAIGSGGIIRYVKD